jgi:hypothetical protein
LYSGNERYRYTSAKVQAEAWPFAKGQLWLDFG